MKLPALIICTVVGVSVFLTCTRVDASKADKGTLYDVYERTFKTSGISEKGDGWKSRQDMTVTFTKGNDSITLPGFWAGADQWKFRASLPSPGTWEWSVSAPGLNFSIASGYVNIKVPSGDVNLGFVHGNPSYPHSISYSRNNTPVFVWGNTGYLLLQRALDGDNWKAFIDSTQKYGMNMIRFLVTMWGFGNGTQCPWKNCTYEAPHYGAFNPDYWDTMDRIIKYLQQRDMIAELILFPDASVPGRNDSGHDPNGREGMYNMSKAQEEAYVRYAVARYAAYTNVIWCIANEWAINNRARYEGVTDSAPYFRSDFSNKTHIDESGKLVAGGFVTRSWVENIGNYLYDVDPYIERFGRLASVHNPGKQWFHNDAYVYGKFLFNSEKWATSDIIQYHNERNSTEADVWGHHGIAINRADKVPVFNDEYGYEGYRGTTSTMSRKAGWGIAIEGGYGSWGDDTGDEKGNHYGDFGYAGALLGVWRGNARTPPTIRVMTGIMRSLQFWKMAPHNELLTSKPLRGNAYLLAEPGKQYLMYAANGGYTGNFEVNLLSGTYHGRWISTTSGETAKAVNAFTTTGGEKKFTAPDFSNNEDIVLLIERTKSK